MPSQHLTFQWVPRPQANKLIATWRQLAQHAPTTLFTSVGWVQSWLQAYGEPDWMLKIVDQQQLVSVSLWREQYHRRPMGFHVRTLHLQHTGDEALDQIWPEYNGLLGRLNYLPAIYQQLLDNIFSVHPFIDEVDTGLMLEQISTMLSTNDFINEEIIKLSSYVYVAQNATKNFGFSSGLRAEINRTERGLRELTIAPVDVSFERDRSQCWVQFTEMKNMHIDAWGDTSGFLNPDFMRFHQSLITNASEDVTPIISSVIVNGELLGRHYLLQHKNVLYFYLGVANKNVGKRIKIGTYLHAKTIEQLQGFDCLKYDFLGGDFNYKKRMATDVLPMCRTRIKKKSVKSQIEKTLKHVKKSAEVVLRNG